MQDTTVISSPQAQERMTDWMNCLPGDLSDLFYFHHEKSDGTTEYTRFDNCFSLGKDGIEQLLHLHGNATMVIRIYMGCNRIIDPVTENARDVFYPVFCIKAGDGGATTYYEMKYIPTSLMKGLGESIITPGTADLFRAKWNELNDTEVGMAFSGATLGCKNCEADPMKPEEKVIKNRRVEYYEFPNSDVNNMIKALLAYMKEGGKSPYLYFCMGAGLSVQIDHPFNFRPIIKVPSGNQLFHPASGGFEVAHPVAYFERSKPCPPFCDPTE